jgi:hypothetical protein
MAMSMEQNDLDILAQHADQLSRSPGSDLQKLQVSQQHEELRSLMRLAEQVKRVLAPVGPSPHFRQRLGSELTEMAQRRRTQELLIETPSSRKELLIGAAIGSAVALAGGVVYLLRTQMQDRSRGVSHVQT